jgi:hypothetical protein
MDHTLLDRIIRASERLSRAELEMLENVARRMKEEAAEATKDEDLLVAREPDISDLALKKI